MQSFFQDISKYDQVLEAPIKNQVANLYDYDSLASFRIQSQSILLDTTAEMQQLLKRKTKKAAVDSIELEPFECRIVG